MNVQDPPNEATRSARRPPRVCFSAKVRLDVPADLSSLGDARDHPALAVLIASGNPWRGAVRPIEVLVHACRYSHRASGLGMRLCALLDAILVLGARRLVGNQNGRIPGSFRRRV